VLALAAVYPVPDARTGEARDSRTRRTLAGSSGRISITFCAEFATVNINSHPWIGD